MDVEEIVAGLTDAQKRGILRACAYFDDYEIWLDDDDCEELEAIGITGEAGWIDRLTSLGMAVRSHLKATTDAK